MDTTLKQDAEIALYLKDYDEAEALYRRMDRPDLAIDMRMRLEDWFAVRPHLACTQDAMQTVGLAVQLMSGCCTVNVILDKEVPPQGISYRIAVAGARWF